LNPARFLDRNTPPHILTLVSIAGVSALTMNIFLPSLPAMARYFHTDYAVMQLALSGYLAGTAVIQLVIGPLSDLLGRRPVMLSCLVLMLIGTLICALAPNITVFMIGRVLQTATVAGFVLARAIVRDMVPMEKAASMIGYVTMGTSMVPMVGPTIGGLLNELFGWQSNFALLFGLAAAALALAFADLGETNRQKAPSFMAQFHAWPELFRSGHFWAYTLTATFSSGVFFCFLGGAPYVGSILYALTPSQLGLLFFFCSAGYVFGNFLSGRYAGRFGTSAMMISGSVVTLSGIVLAMLLIMMGADTPLAFFGPLSLVGIGNGLSLPSANAGIVSVKPHLAGSASGVGGAITIGGGAALSVLAGAVLSEDTGTLPLLSVMFACALLALAATLFERSASQTQALSPERRP